MALTALREDHPIFGYGAWYLSSFPAAQLAGVGRFGVHEGKMFLIEPRLVSLSGARTRT